MFVVVMMLRCDAAGEKKGGGSQNAALPFSDDMNESREEYFDE